MPSSGVKIIDRAKLVKILQRLGSENESEVVASARAAIIMLRNANKSWEDIVPGSKVKVDVRDTPPPFVEPITMSLEEALEVLITKGNDDQKAMALTLRETKRSGDTITGQGIRLVHRYAAQIRSRK